MKMKNFKALLCIFALILALFVISGCKPETDTPEVSDDGTSEAQGPVWLDAPENLKLEGFTLSFDAVEGAKGYLLDISGRVYIPETRETVYSLERETTENIIDLTTTLSPGESYSISVYALGTDGDVITDSDPTTIDVITEGVTPGLEFILNDDGESYTVSKGTSKTAKHLIFPDTYNGKPITKLTGHFGRYGLNMQSASLLPTELLRLPNSICEIGDSAFCKLSITELTLPDTLKKLDDHAFHDCKMLEKINFSAGLEYIGASSFTYVLISDLDLPKSVKYIGESAFATSKVTSLSVPRAIEYIDGSAFSGTPWLDALPEGPIYIEHILYGYKSTGKDIQSFTVPDGIVAISSYTFNGFKSLKSVILPNGLETIGNSAFGYCSELTSISLPETLTNIMPSAFEFSGIRSINIPGGVKKIEDFTFNGCTELREVTLGLGIETIGSAAFQSCCNISSVSLPQSIISIEQLAFSHSGIKTLELPNKLRSLGSGAFADLPLLQSVTFPASLEQIESGCFSNCVLLSVADLSHTALKAINKSTFSGCVSLREIHLPDAVSEIDIYAFSNTAIAELRLPASIESFLAMTVSDCRALKTIVIPKGVSLLSLKGLDTCHEAVALYYEGTREDIASVKKRDLSGKLTDAYDETVNIYYYSDAQPTTEGKYWCYEGGTIKKYY